MMLDVRGLNPPQPAVMIIEAVGKLKTGDTLEVIGDRPFVDMIPKLEGSGYTVEIREIGGFFVLRITKTENSKELTMEVKECDDKLDEITEETNVGKLLKAYPESLKILVKYGFSPLENPEMRKTLARTITLRQAKKLIGMSDEKFKEMMAELKAIEKP
jgi:TusA-related sulfurtransferase